MHLENRAERKVENSRDCVGGCGCACGVFSSMGILSVFNSCQFMPFSGYRYRSNSVENDAIVDLDSLLRAMHFPSMPSNVSFVTIFRNGNFFQVGNISFFFLLLLFPSKSFATK